MTAILPKPAASSVDVAIELYNELLEVPVVSSARITGNTLEISTSHRSISQLVKRNAAQTLILDSANEVIATTPLVFTSHEVLHTSRSPDGKRTAVYRANGTGKERKLLIEIWETEEGVKLEEFDVGKNHGDWYFDGTFATPSWHPEGHSIVYTAEAPSIPTESPPFASSFVYKPDMGETFTGKKEPTIFLLLLKDSPYRLGQESSSANRLSKDSPSIHRLTNSETKVFGQPCFLPSLDGSTPRIVATSFSLLADGRRLGQVYCTNRPVAVNELILSPTATANDDANEGADEEQTWTAKEIQQISPVGRSARSPRVLFPAAGSNDSYTIVYISNAEGGPHGSCGRLHSLNGILIDTVSAPKSLDSFPGLYTDQIPASPFLRLDSGVFLVVTSIWRSRKVPLLIHLETGEVTCLASWTEPSADPVFPYFGAEAKEMMKSYTVLGTDGGKRIVVTRSSLTSPVEVVVAEVSGGEGIEWKVVKKTKLSARVSKALETIDWTVLPLPKFEPSEIILLSPITIDQAAPARIDLPPLITFPHGGPHSTSTTDFAAQSIALAFAGYRVAWINYPGSLGFGQDFVESLPPALATLDVEATLATSHYLNALSLASRTKGKKLLMGGSHGGFISAHLTSRYPEEYDACVMRNPVVDLPSMIYASDIPDWIYAETLHPYTFSAPPTTLSPDLYARLHSLSPLKLVDAVITPTLLMIGANDRRVPPDQGRTWFHALQSKVGGRTEKVETEMMWFPGNGHALDSTVETEIVNFAAGLRWLERFTQF